MKGRIIGLVATLSSVALLLLLIFSSGVLSMDEGLLSYVETSMELQVEEIPAQEADNFLKSDEHSLPSNIIKIVRDFLREKYRGKEILGIYLLDTSNEEYHIVAIVADNREAEVLERLYIELIVTNKEVINSTELELTLYMECKEKSLKTIDHPPSEDENFTVKLTFISEEKTYEAILKYSDNSSHAIYIITLICAIEGKNIFGLTLWKLVSKGEFGVHHNAKVLYVKDAFWSYKNFKVTNGIVLG